MPAWQKRHPRVQPRRILDIQTVVDDLGERDNHGLVRIGFGKALPEAFLDNGRHIVKTRNDPASLTLCLVLFENVVQRRNIDSWKLRHGVQHIGARRALVFHATVKLEQFRKGLLAFPEHDRVEKRGVRLRVESAWAAAEDHGVGLIAIDAAQRHAGKVEELKHVSRSKLVRQRDSYGVEFGHGSAALQGECGDALGPHQIAHIGSGKKCPLRRHAFDGVDAIAEDAYRLVRLPELVRVGIGHAEAIRRLGLVRASPFVVQIASRALDGAARLTKEPFYSGPEVCHMDSLSYEARAPKARAMMYESALGKTTGVATKR